MRIDSRHDKMCAKITMCDGGELPWVDVIRYLGVFVIRGAKFKCSIDKAKRSFYRAANGIFAKIGRLASEEVMVQLDPEIHRVELHDRSRTIADRLDRSAQLLTPLSTRLWSTAINLIDFLVDSLALLPVRLHELCALYVNL